MQILLSKHLYLSFFPKWSLVISQSSVRKRLPAAVSCLRHLRQVFNASLALIKSRGDVERKGSLGSLGALDHLGGTSLALD